MTEEIEEKYKHECESRKYQQSEKNKQTNKNIWI